MCGVDRRAMGITLKPLAGWSLWLPLVKEGIRSGEMLVPWDF